MSEQYKRRCATCYHYRPIGAPIPSPCVGCIQGGACVKWTPGDASGARDEDGRT